MFLSVSQKFKILRCCQLNKTHLVAGLSPKAASLLHLIEGIHFLVSKSHKVYWVGESETEDSCLRLSSAYF